jgi:hypothetical protein
MLDLSLNGLNVWKEAIKNCKWAVKLATFDRPSVTMQDIKLVAALSTSRVQIMCNLVTYALGPGFRDKSL